MKQVCIRRTGYPRWSGWSVAVRGKFPEELGCLLEGVRRGEWCLTNESEKLNSSDDAVPKWWEGAEPT